MWGWRGAGAEAGGQASCLSYFGEAWFQGSGFRLQARKNGKLANGNSGTDIITIFPIDKTGWMEEGAGS
jgi:hypothetical protein